MLARKSGGTRTSASLTMTRSCFARRSSSTSLETFAFAPRGGPHTISCASLPGNSCTSLRTIPQTGSSAAATPKRICVGPLYCCVNQLRRQSSVAASHPLSGLSKVTGGWSRGLRVEREQLDPADVGCCGGLETTGASTRWCSGKRHATSHCHSVRTRLSMAREPKIRFRIIAGSLSSSCGPS